MTNRVLTGDEPTYTFGHIRSVQSCVTRANSFTLDREICILIPKLMQKLENDINTSKDIRLLGRHIVNFMFAKDLDIG